MPAHGSRKLRETLTDRSVRDALSRFPDEQTPLTDRAAHPKRGTRPPPALSLPEESGAASGRPRLKSLAGVAIAGALVIGVGGALVLRPQASVPPSVGVWNTLLGATTAPAGEPYRPRMARRPAPRTAPSRPARYAVRVGPYQRPAAVMAAYERLRTAGFTPALIYGAEGAYLRACTTPEEMDASHIARRLQGQGYTAVVTEPGLEAGVLKGSGPSRPRYRVSGVRVDFEGGQSKGWEMGGSAVAMRNSSLFAFSGEHALEVALREASNARPGTVWLKPESVVLPADRFLAYVLQPTATAERLGARVYVTDARGQTSRNLAQPLEAGKWVELQFLIPPETALPIREIGLEFRSRQSPWTGTVYIDRVEQQRPW